MINNTVLKKELQADYEKYSHDHHIPYKELLNEGVIKTLKELKKRNKKIAIASSTKKKEIERFIKECGLVPFIDYYISGESCENNKPDPEIYLDAIRSLNMKKEECIAIEDSKVGIKSAKSAGLYVLALEPDEYEIDQSNADKVINNLEDILYLL